MAERKVGGIVSFIMKVSGILFSCLLVITGAVLLLDIAGLTHIVRYGYEAFSSSTNTLFFICLGAILLVAGFLLLCGALFVRPPKVAKVPGTEQSNDIYVSLPTIQDIIRRTAFATPGIVGINTRIRTGKKGLKLELRVKVNYEDKITTITQYLQHEVKKVVEESTSLPVHSVNVLVTKADTEIAAGAEKTGNNGNGGK